MSTRKQKPTRRGMASGAETEDAPTTLYDGDAGDNDGPTAVDILAAPEAPPASGTARMIAISMKTPTGQDKPNAKVEREMPHIKLRAMSEVVRAHQPQNLGNYAPPYNAAEARNRSVREYLLWGCLGVILACAIALVIWFVGT